MLNGYCSSTELGDEHPPREALELEALLEKLADWELLLDAELLKEADTDAELLFDAEEFGQLTSQPTVKSIGLVSVPVTHEAVFVYVRQVPGENRSQHHLQPPTVVHDAEAGGGAVGGAGGGMTDIDNDMDIVVDVDADVGMHSAGQSIMSPASHIPFPHVGETAPRSFPERGLNPNCCPMTNPSTRTSVTTVTILISFLSDFSI